MPPRGFLGLAGHDGAVLKELVAGRGGVLGLEEGEFVVEGEEEFAVALSDRVGGFDLLFEQGEFSPGVLGHVFMGRWRYVINLDVKYYL